MFKKPPPFWKTRFPHWGVLFLWPFLIIIQKIFLFVGRCKRMQHTHSLNLPVFCVGNVTMGGQGKTPTCLALYDLFVKNSSVSQPHFLTRGYGGRLSGITLVDPVRHSFQEVGDEALLLAHKGPTWKSADRALSGQKALEEGATCLILDDGLQNPSLFKNASLLVVDGTYGFGNGKVFPCGPLREPLLEALKKTTALIIIGNDTADVSSLLKVHAPHLPIFSGEFVPCPSQIEKLKHKRLFAFAGIGIPQKFFSMLLSNNLSVIGTKAYSDHHPYHEAELETLMRMAHEKKAHLVTTQKDLMRIPEKFHKSVDGIDVDLCIEKPEELLHLLTQSASLTIPPRDPPSLPWVSKLKKVFQ